MRQANQSRLDHVVEAVAFKHLCRKASAKAWVSFPKVASSSDFNSIVVGDFLSAFSSRVAFGNLVSQAKKVIQLFTKAPQLWDAFKKLMGVESLADIPSAIAKLGKMAISGLKKALHTMFVSWPLKLFTLPHQKIFSFNTWLEALMKRHPDIRNWIVRVSNKIGDFGEMVRQKAPHITGIVMAAIYMWVWLNVVEFEWDIHSFLKALTGHMDFHELITTLPGSSFGFLLNIFDIGTFTLLPYTMSARILVLIYNQYLEWEGGSFIPTHKFYSDFGVQAEAF